MPTGSVDDATGKLRVHTVDCAEDTVILMRADSGRFLDGHGGRRSRGRAFMRGQTYRVCPHTAATLVGCGRARLIKHAAQ